MTTETGPVSNETTPQRDLGKPGVSDAEHLALVVGHDGHSASAAALRTAIRLARLLGAHLHVVHSVTLQDYGLDPDIDAFEQEGERNVSRERAVIADAMTGTSVPWTYHEQRGDPADQLARLAAEVDAVLIVVGATAHGPVHHVLGGDSVPKRLLHMQARPVVVVPPARAAR
jgi:nucleotide-binding universal stress UspA family protein